MAKANGRPRGRPPHKNSKAAPSEPGDEQGAYTHAQLVRIDNRLRARLLRAFKRGKENRQAAAATYDANRANPTGRPRSFGVPGYRPRDAVEAPAFAARVGS